jgi:hypothetical protein
MNSCKQLYSKRIICLLLVWLILTGFARQALWAEDPNQPIRNITENEMPAILQMIGSHIHDNFKRINTWTGEINENITWIHTGTSAKNLFENATDTKGTAPNAIKQKVVDKIVFAIDANKDCIYIDNIREKPSQYFNQDTGGDLGNSKSTPYRYTIISKPEYLLKSEPRSFNKNNEIFRMRAVKKAPKQDLRTGLYRLV